MRSVYHFKRILCFVLSILMITSSLGASTHAHAEEGATEGIQLGSFLEFGSFSDGSPAIWQVVHLEDDIATIYSTSVFSGEYDASIHMRAVTVSFTKYNSYGSASWEHSDVRNWLNSADASVSYGDVIFDYNTFGSGIASIYKDAENPPSYSQSVGFLHSSHFSADESALLVPKKNKQLIPVTESGKTSVHSNNFRGFPDSISAFYEDPYGVSETRDKVFLLSALEFKEYVLDNGLSGYKHPNGNNYPAFWLRDSAYYDFAGFYYYYGTHALEVSGGNVSSNEADLGGGIRPACCIDLQYVVSLDGTGSYQDPFQMTIAKSLRSGIELASPYGSTLYVGQESKIQVRFPEDAVERNVSWSSSADDVASVDINGNVKARKVGNTAITATLSDGSRKRIWIHVTDRSLTDYYNYGYSFRHTLSSFGYSTGYHFPVSRYLQLGFGLAQALVYSSLIKWNGVCFGMSASSVLFYMDYLAEESIDKNVHFPRSFQAPKSSSKEDQKLRSLIDLLYLSQMNANKLDFNPSVIASEIRSGRPVVLGLSSGGNHAVVAYDFVMEDDSYRFFIWDCNGQIVSLRYKDPGDYEIEYGNSSTTTAWKPIAYCTYEELVRLYRRISFGISFEAAFVELMSETPEADAAMFLITADREFEITNSLGESALISDLEISGTIENMRIVSGDQMEDDSEYMVIMPMDVYTFNNLTAATISADSEVIFVQNSFANPIVADFDSLCFDFATENGDSLTFRYTMQESEMDSLIISMTAAENVSIILDDTNATVYGIDSLDAKAVISGREYALSALTSGSSASISLHGLALPDHEQAPMPVFDLEGGAYETGILLRVLSTPDELVYYTTDGSEPTEGNGILYIEPIPVTQSTTVKAITVKPGFLQSDITEQTYILPSTEAPCPNYGSGNYDSVLFVDFTYEENTAVFYTTDGSDPVENGILYGASIVITEDTLLQACSVRNGCVSPVSSFQYSVSPREAMLFCNSPVDQYGMPLDQYNLDELQSIQLAVDNLRDSDGSVCLILAFYDYRGKMTDIYTEEAAITSGVNRLSIPITRPVGDAAYMKAIIVDSKEYSPITSDYRCIFLD